MIDRNQSHFVSPSETGPCRLDSLSSRLLRLIADHPFAFWIPTLLLLASGVAVTVTDSMSGSAGRVGLFLGVTLLTSVAAGFTIARLVDGPDATFRTTAEVEHHCQIPVLGVVPINCVLQDHRS